MSRFTKAIFVNSYAYNAQHEIINSVLLKATNDIFESVTVVTDRSAWESMNSNFSYNCDARFIKVFSGESKLAYIGRYLLSSLYNIFYLIGTSKRSVIIYSFNNLFSLHIVNLINKIKKKDVLIFCHGEMELLTSDEGGILAKVMRKLCRSFFLSNRISDKIKFCVLGDSIKENLMKVLPEGNRLNFCSIDHPYIFKSASIKNRDYDNKIIKLGTIGELNEYKGANRYLDLLSKFSKIHIKKDCFEFYSIGRVTSRKNELENFGVKIPSKGESLSREEFDNYTNSLDYILYFYSKDKYKLIASGAIFDAINHSKPVIALKNDYFEYLFNKFGCIGYLCDNVDEMIDIIRNLDEGSLEYDFSSYYENLSPEKFTQNLRKLIELM